MVSPYSTKHQQNNTTTSTNRRSGVGGSNRTSPNFYVERAKELKNEWGALCEKNPHFLSPRSQQRAAEVGTSKGGVTRDVYKPSATDVDGHIPGTHRSVSRDRPRSFVGDSAPSGVSASRHRQRSSPPLLRNQSPPLSQSASNRQMRGGGVHAKNGGVSSSSVPQGMVVTPQDGIIHPSVSPCLLYTSDAADEEDSVDLGGRRIIKKKKKGEKSKNE
eukprot:TRINITY_DN13100_c0_g2_i1.p1 TRINITY_DN13100_c0_g2~~TRINITY_DN13100_c0_g2_i1.p1  ORF type:complete len:217 (-),score=32.45 TRINITY_DN13100_c0_g2_i1:87-737(-)